MKNLVLFSISALVGLGLGTAQAQTDSARTTYGQEPFQNDTSAQRSGSRFVKAYQKFIRAQVEEKTLIKLGAVPEFGYAGYVGPAYGVQTEVGIERKLIPALSVMTAVRTRYRRLGELSEEVTVRGVLAGRWYYAQNRRMQTGKSANNFSNQYLTLQVGQPLLSRTRERQTGETFRLQTDNYVGVGFGIQRRLGRLGYIDWNVGPAYSLNRKQGLVIAASVYFGLGL